jgi:DNA-binding transcriptional LysR family regulator
VFKPRKAVRYGPDFITVGYDRVLFRSDAHHRCGTSRMSPLRTPEIAELRTFCLAADLGSLGRAAMRLNLSQPALSKRLQSLEALAGCKLLNRSSRGVTLTDDGRRLYDQAHRLLEQAAAVEAVLDALKQTTGPVVLAASHSAAEAFVGDWLAEREEAGDGPVELVMANSQVVRRLVADGRAEIGIAASRPSGIPNLGVVEEVLVEDEIVYAVPLAHPWAHRPSVSAAEFARTPVVVRDPASNARWTVEAELRRSGLRPPPSLMQSPTPAGAKRGALARQAPVLLSRHVLQDDARFTILPVRDLRFPRSFELVLPAGTEPEARVRRLADGLRALTAVR